MASGAFERFGFAFLGRSLFVSASSGASVIKGREHRPGRMSAQAPRGWARDSGAISGRPGRPGLASAPAARSPRK
jgi:hypothetical protein